MKSEYPAQVSGARNQREKQPWTQIYLNRSGISAFLQGLKKGDFKQSPFDNPSLPEMFVPASGCTLCSALVVDSIDYSL